MDKRGLTTDPNADSLIPAWYDALGATRQPSPYATASWAYRHDWVTEEEALLTEGIIDSVIDNGSNFAVHLYPAAYDSEFFWTPKENPDTFDEGGYTEEGDLIEFKRRYFGSVKVYDTWASYAYRDNLDLKVLKSDGSIGNLTSEADPSNLIEADNGFLFSIPTPGLSFNSGPYPQLGSGVVLNEMVYQINKDNEQEILDDSYFVDEEVDYSVPLGDTLGEVHYEICDSSLTITDWSHYNWQDATPVIKAVKVLLNEMPTCVEVVMVEDRPNAMWTSLGFCYPEKGSNILVHKDSLNRVSTY